MFGNHPLERSFWHMVSLHVECSAMPSHLSSCPRKRLGPGRYMGWMCWREVPRFCCSTKIFFQFLKNNGRERHNRKHCTNQEVSLFQTSNSSEAMSSSKFSGWSPLLNIAWQNDKCACSCLGEECMPVMVRDLSQVSTEITLGTFSAGVNTPAPSQLFKYIPATKMKCMITRNKGKGRRECEKRVLQIPKAMAGSLPLFASI